MVDETLPIAPGYLTVGQAADRLSLDENTVRDLIASGELPAVRLGRAWMIPLDAVELRGSQEPRPGRRLVTSNAWAILYMAVGMPVPWLDRKRRWRLQQYLKTHRLSELRSRLADRGRPRSYRAHPSLIAGLRSDSLVMLTGPAGASEMRLGLIGGGDEVEVYVGAADLPEVVLRHHLRPTSDPNAILRVVPEFELPWPPARVAPISAIALDLLDNREPRARQVGEEVLRGIEHAYAHQDHADR